MYFSLSMPNYAGKDIGTRKEEHGYMSQLMTVDKLSHANEVDYGNNFGQNLQVFSLASIIQATNNFSSKLGGGGFGPVYKVKIREGICLHDLYAGML